MHLVHIKLLAWYFLFLRSTRITRAIQNTPFTELEMKALLIAATLVLGFSVNAHAKASKICYGMGDAKGSHFVAEISRHQVIVSEAVGDEVTAYEGTHAYIDDVQGRDGVTYNEFATEVHDEGGVTMLVDESLVDGGTKGVLKLRWRGESFSETKFLCRDQ
jgi:hypothetical protein